jgi:3-oxoacyl-(acyl-carrier-protein) synthase
MKTAYIEFPTGEIPDGAWAARFSTSCPRFGRMDALSRLALMAVEALGVEFQDKDEVGVVLETHYGSLLADRQFLRTNSPSVFTYTLPSTAIGEICIRHKLRGPVLCLMTETGDGRQALEQAQAWLATGEVKSCLCLCADASGAGPAVAGALYLQSAVALTGSLLDVCRAHSV